MLKKNRGSHITKHAWKTDKVPQLLTVYVDDRMTITHTRQ